MDTAQRVKKFPCEGCREQKRKCDARDPCDRCERFNLKCVYLKTVSPHDKEFVEYAQEERLSREIQRLTAETDNLERQLNNLRVPAMQLPLSPPHSVDEPKMIIHKPKRMFPPKQAPHFVLASHGRTSAVVSRAGDKRKRWTLSVSHGRMTIQTDIKSHRDLLSQLSGMFDSLRHHHVPFAFYSHSNMGGFLHAFNGLIVNKYGKAWCRSIVASLDLSNDPVSPLSVSEESISEVLTSLLDAYLSCHHIQEMALHVPTFFRLFVTQKSNLVKSPPVMALCAAICTRRCDHIARIIPHAELPAYAQAFFSHVQMLAKGLFDDISLESLATYVFMADYCCSMRNHDEAENYIDHARRLSHLLMTEYPANQPENALLSRLTNHLVKLHTIVLASRAHANDERLSPTGYIPIYAACHHLNATQWIPLADDTDEESRALQLHSHLSQLRSAVYGASRTQPTGDLSSMAEQIVEQQMENVMAHWYNHQLPHHFKLSLPLMDALCISDEMYFRTLNVECCNDPSPIMATLSLYNECLLIGGSFLPKRIPHPDFDWELMHYYWQGKIPERPSGLKWTKRLQKLLSMRDAVDFEGGEDEFFSIMDAIMFPEHPPDSFIVFYSVHAAINGIRLLRYLRATYPCLFDMQILMNAWIVLYRTLMFEPYLSAKFQPLCPRIRADLAVCLDIARSELDMRPTLGLRNALMRMENEYNSLVN